jgi:hypothetical protein
MLLSESACSFPFSFQFRSTDVNDFEIFMFTAEKMILKVAVTVLDFENSVKFVVLALEKCCWKS